MDKKRRFWIILLTLAGLLGLATVIFYRQAENGGVSEPAAASPDSAGKNTGGNKGGKDNEKSGGKPAGVETATVTPDRFIEEIQAIGTLKSNESVILRPETSGRIAALHFMDGQYVERGHLLVELDAGIQAAELQQAKANQALAKANQQRNEDLFQKKFVSQQALDNARAALKVQEAAVALAEARLDKTRVRAPFSGVLGIRNISVGDYIREGEILVNLEDISTLKADFQLPEIYLSRLQKGLTLEISLDGLPGQKLNAKLEAIDPQVDKGSRSVSCRALLLNQEGRLRGGMFARIKIILGGRDTLMIPEQAVITGGSPQVFLVENRQAKSVPVRLGERREGKVEVLEGLKAGDVVIASGQLKIRDGQVLDILK